MASLARGVAEIAKRDAEAPKSAASGLQGGASVYATQTLATLAAFARALLRPKRAVDCVGGEWAPA